MSPYNNKRLKYKGCFIGFMQENTYDRDISQWYDAIVNAGYYDYNATADSIVQVLGLRKKVLELGIGTGLLAEKLIERGLNVSGFDFSRSMLEIAVGRLGSKVKLYEQDVLDLDLSDTYEAAISHGGVWVGIEDGKCIDSHITNPERNLEGLRRVAHHLISNGLLVIDIQPEHKNCTGVALGNGAEYSSDVTFQGDLAYKQHLVQRDGEVLAKQNVIIRRFNGEAYTRMMNLAGFTNLGEEGRLLVFQKK